MDIQERRMALWTDMYLMGPRTKAESIKAEPFIHEPKDENAKSSRCVAADRALREFDEAFGLPDSKSA